jgi:hypothetical protein
MVYITDVILLCRSNSFERRGLRGCSRLSPEAEEEEEKEEERRQRGAPPPHHHHHHYQLLQQKASNPSADYQSAGKLTIFAH